MENIEETVFCIEETVEILDVWKNSIVDALDPPIVERLMKLRLIEVEKLDIVESKLSLIVDEFEAINVDRVDIVDMRPELIVDELEPIVVDSVETDNFRLEKFEPATVDTKAMLLSM
jgi:hypothetical protein